MLATLERKKYIVKQHFKNDKRKINVNITPIGKQIIIKSEPFFTEFVTKMENGISDSERKLLTSILNKIQNNIIGEGPSPFFKTKK
jgi:DNA-binding MarR family transcriptional regulator